MSLNLSVTQQSALCGTIALSGMLNTDSAPELDLQIQRMVASGVRVVTLGLAKLEMITSAGVGVVMKVQTTLARKGGELVFVDMPVQIKKVFEIVRLLPTLKVFENARETDEYLVAVQQRLLDDESFSSD